MITVTNCVSTEVQPMIQLEIERITLYDSAPALLESSQRRCK